MQSFIVVAAILASPKHKNFYTWSYISFQYLFSLLICTQPRVQRAMTAYSFSLLKLNDVFGYFRQSLR